MKTAFLKKLVFEYAYIRSLHLATLLSFVSILALGLSVHAQEANIPSNLGIPESNLLLLDVIAEGVQIYRCDENAEASGTFIWAFVDPRADLYNEEYERLGIHYGGPTWEANDGSIVVGTVLERADSPTGAIPWLLLEGSAVSGNGIFSHVTFIQRINTIGGLAPSAESCTQDQLGKLARIPYTAQYRFYAAAPLDMHPVNLPENLVIPEGNHLSFQIMGDGVQIYRCQESADTAGTFSWVFVEPDAYLLNATNNQIGIHYAGPTWESNDGSSVVGEVVERVDSPDRAIPWLLLRAVSTSGNGSLSDISYIQRLDTVGGLAPAAETCNAENSQTTVRIPYTALYVFYAAD